MAHAKKQEDLPGWFPFAILASLLVMIGAGTRSGWKTSGTTKPPPAPNPPLQTGALQDWLGITTPRSS